MAPGQETQGLGFCEGGLHLNKQYSATSSHCGLSQFHLWGGSLRNSFKRSCRKRVLMDSRALCNTELFAAQNVNTANSNLLKGS